MSLANSKSVVICVLAIWTSLATLWMVTVITSNNNFDCSQKKTLREAELPPATTLATTLATESAFSKRLKYYSSKVYRAGVNESLDQEKCTLIILTYRRDKLLSNFLPHYCRMNQLLQRIIVVSNNVTNSTATQQPLLQCTVELIFVQSAENKLTNRYIPRKEIETDCVSLMNDDQLVSVYDVHFGLTVWQNFRYRIVGFEEKILRVNPNETYSYSGYSRRFINLKTRSRSSSKVVVEIWNGTKILHVGNRTFVLGTNTIFNNNVNPLGRQKLPSILKNSEGYGFILNSCFLHKAYLEMYFDPLMVPSGALERVESVQDCETVLMNIVVTKFLEGTNRGQCGPLAVKNTVAIKYLKFEEANTNHFKEHEQRSGRPSNIIQHSECLDKLAHIYGYLSLHPSNNIATMI